MMQEGHQFNTYEASCCRIMFRLSETLHVLRRRCEDGRTLLLILSCCGIVPSPAGSAPLADATVKRNSYFSDEGIPCFKSYINQTSRAKDFVQNEVSVHSFSSLSYDKSKASS